MTVNGRTVRERLTPYVKSIPGVQSVLQSRGWKDVRHRLTLAFGQRRNETYTQFLRLPGQYDALCGPVVDSLLSDGMKRDIKIIVMGCSNGAEPYSISSVLRQRRPGLGFRVRAYDLDGHMIKRARQASYMAEEIFDNRMISDSFIENTFDVNGRTYSVKDEVAGHVSFGLADALEPELLEKTGTADIIYAQNFLVHMEPRIAERAFENICRLLEPRAALFIDGMDLGLRHNLTKKHNLTPLRYRIRDIHEEAMRARGGGWPYVYWGLEPFSDARGEWQRRYATVFLKGAGNRR